MSLELGCLTQYQLFSSVSFSFRMNGSQFGSSPVGIRSGFVSTPSMVIKLRDRLERITGKAYQSCASLRDHAPSQVDVLLGSRNQLERGKKKEGKTSQDYTIRKRGELYYFHTRRWARWCNLAFLYKPSLSFRQAQCHCSFPECYWHLQLILVNYRKEIKKRKETWRKKKRRYNVPGRSQNDRSATWGPLICNETQFVEKLNSETRFSSSSFSKKSFGAFVGFKMALWARRIRSSTWDWS